MRLHCATCWEGLDWREDLVGVESSCPACGVRLRFGTSSDGSDSLGLVPTVDLQEPIWPDSEVQILRGQQGVQVLIEGLRKRAGYRDEGRFAGGGMGELRQVKDEGLRRTVAKKMMRYLDRASERDVARFIEEAEVTGQLQHPGVVAVHELGVDEEGAPFYTMTKIDGEDLQEVIGRVRGGHLATLEAWSIARMVRVFRQVCETMAYAHSRGVVHRDLKPSNVVVGAFGVVKVIDWGLAKILSSSAPARVESVGCAWGASGGTEPEPLPVGSVRAEDESGALQSMAGSVRGTPCYMSPEQARGEEVDVRTDVYALGAILYAMCALRPPVRGRNQLDVLEKVKVGNLSPMADVPDVNWSPPAGLVAIAWRAMSLRVENRYASVDELLADLDRYEGGYAPKAQDAGLLQEVALFVRRHRLAAVFSVLLLGAIVAGAAASIVQGQRAVANLERFEAEEQGRLALEAKLAVESRKSAPAFLDAARGFLKDVEMDKARLQAREALTRDPSLREARELLVFIDASEGRIEIAREGAAELQSEFGSHDLLPVLGQIEEGDASAWRLLARLAADAGYSRLSAELVQRSVQGMSDDLEAFIPDWQVALNRAVPGLGDGLLFDPELGLSLEVGSVPLRDLEALDFLPLNALDTGEMVSGEPLDLEPLRGMPLKRFRSLARIQNLEPICSPSLKDLDIHLNAGRDNCDWTPLQEIFLERFVAPVRVEVPWVRTRRLEFRAPMKDVKWVTRIEGLEEVHFYRAVGEAVHPKSGDDYRAVNLRPLASIPGLRRIVAVDGVKINHATVGLAPTVPGVDVEELGQRLGEVKARNEYVDWWAYNWEMQRYLIRRRFGLLEAGEVMPEVLAASPYVKRVGDRFMALVNPETGNHLDYYGVRLMSLHSEAENEAVLEMLRALTQPGHEVRVRVPISYRINEWHWNNGEPVDFLKLDGTIHQEDQRGRVWMGESGWTGNGPTTFVKVIEWPAEVKKDFDGSPIAYGEREFVHRQFPNVVVSEFEGAGLAIIMKPTSWRAAQWVASEYGGELPRLTAKERDHVLWMVSHYGLARDQVWQELGVEMAEFWVGNQAVRPRLGEAMVQKLKSLESISALFHRPFVVKWARAGDVPKMPAEFISDSEVWPLRRRLFAGAVYQMVPQNMNWHRAHAFAAYMGGHLACVSHRSELEFLSQEFGTGLRAHTWLGGTDAGTGIWRWTSGEPWTLGPEDWWSGQPTNGKGEDHLCLLGEFGLVDEDGRSMKVPLVERPLSEAEWESLAPAVRKRMEAERAVFEKVESGRF